MHRDFPDIIRAAGKAEKIELLEVIQELWSGYGTIRRYRLHGSELPSLVVKHVDLGGDREHPRGWNSNLSHQRKLRSYQVETNWYKNWSSYCDHSCQLPRCLALEIRGEEVLIVLEDLDAIGFPDRREQVDWKEISACLHWLANFHAIFLGHNPEGLWSQGSYWHLATRPDELAALDDMPLRNAAAEIDQQLNQSPFQTILHGDAKLANFCFSPAGDRVAAVDFQYVGSGCGMKDVAYFIGSCLHEEDCRRYEDKLLDCYFAELKKALQKHHPTVGSNTLETDWRQLYPFAWADFHRFLKGWSPGHWKLSDYSEQMTRKVIAQLAAKN